MTSRTFPPNLNLAKDLHPIDIENHCPIIEPTSISGYRPLPTPECPQTGVSLNPLLVGCEYLKLTTPHRLREELFLSSGISFCRLSPKHLAFLNNYRSNLFAFSISIQQYVFRLTPHCSHLHTSMSPSQALPTSTEHNECEGDEGAGP